MLSTLGVNHRLLPYDSLISKIFRNFQVSIPDSIYMETKRIGTEDMTSIRFSRRNGESIKTSTFKNQDTLVAPEDDCMLNDVYPTTQLPDFRLRVRPPLPRHGSVSQPLANSDAEELEMDTNQPPTSQHPPASDHLIQKLISGAQSLSEQQQQLKSQFAAFQLQQQQQLLDQQQQLLDGQRRILAILGSHSRGSFSQPRSQFLHMIFVHALLFSFYILDDIIMAYVLIQFLCWLLDCMDIFNLMILIIDGYMHVACWIGYCL